MQFGPPKSFSQSICLNDKNRSEALCRNLLNETLDMAKLKNRPLPKLRRTPQPPLAYPGSPPDSDRAKKPSLAEPPATDQEINSGDRVEGLGNFGKQTGEFGTVERTNVDDAVVKWDDDGRTRVHQPRLKKI